MEEYTEEDFLNANAAIRRYDDGEIFNFAYKEKGKFVALNGWSWSVMGLIWAGGWEPVTIDSLWESE